MIHLDPSGENWHFPILNLRIHEHLDLCRFSLISDLRFFLISSVSIYCYKLPPEYCLSCIPHILIITQFYVFFHFLWSFLFDTIYLMCCLISTNLEIFLLFLLLISTLIPLWSQNTLYDFNSCKSEVCYLAQVTVYLGECFKQFWKGLWSPQL